MENEVKKEYELAVLLNNETAEAELADLLVKKNKAEIILQEPARLISLAYPIKKYQSATMLVYRLLMFPEQLADFKNDLGFQSYILRFLLTVAPAKEEERVSKKPTPVVPSGISSNELLAKTLERLEVEEIK